MSYLVMSLFLGLIIFAGIAFAEDNSLYPIYQRIKPVFSVTVGNPSADISKSTSNQQTTKSGAEIYQKYCIVCHSTGAAGAPKIGDSAAWEPRLKQSETVLVQHVITGYKAMPPKGTCTDCSDSEIKLAVEYIIKLNTTSNGK